MFSLILMVLNRGLLLGLAMGVLCLLRPLLKRLFTPQQRAILYTGVWGMSGIWHLQAPVTVLPVTFQDLIVPRTGEIWELEPRFLPTYSQPGTYNLALPGGLLVPIHLNDWILGGIGVLWCAGIIAMVCLSLKRRRMLASMVRWKMAEDSLLLQTPLLEEEGAARIWLCRGLPTSFVCRPIFGVGDGCLWHEIYLQEELPPQRMELVLFHEFQHIRLWHCQWKWIGTFCLVLCWWNPLVWLGFRDFCQDLELACDSAVMKRLAPERRKEYAQTLLELGTGRQLWEAPLSFGECDGAARVKALTVWKPGKWWKRLPAWLAVLALVLFFSGGHKKAPLAQDMILRWEREGGGTAAFVQMLGQEMAREIMEESSRSREQGQEGEAAAPAPLAVSGVWKSPQSFPRSALWVQTQDGQWYHVYYGWWGESTGLFGVFSVEETAPPNLEGVHRLI